MRTIGLLSDFKLNLTYSKSHDDSGSLKSLQKMCSCFRNGQKMFSPFIPADSQFFLVPPLLKSPFWGPRPTPRQKHPASELTIAGCLLSGQAASSSGEKLHRLGLDSPSGQADGLNCLHKFTSKKAPLPTPERSAFATSHRGLWRSHVSFQLCSQGERKATSQSGS